MGNNLSVLLNGKVIAALARKHNFCFYGENHLPDEDEIDKTLSDTRQHITSTLVGYATWLATQENPLTESIDDIVTSIKDLIELFEYEVMVAGRNWVLQDLQDQVDVDEGFCGDRPNFIEVIDDNELYKRQQEQEKKESYYSKLRKQLLINKAIADAEKDGVYDAIEHQTSEVDLHEAIDAQHPSEFWDIPNKNEPDDEDDFEKDTLVGPEWDEDGWQRKEDEYLDRQNRQ